MRPLARAFVICGARKPAADIFHQLVALDVSDTFLHRLRGEILLKPDPVSTAPG
jgi:hypothetical protein